MQFSRNRSGAIAAALLSVGVLGVFASLHEYGPESAVRRFHTAAQRGDLPELAEVTAQPADNPAVLFLAGRVKQTLGQGATYRLARMRRDSRTATGAVVYSYPDGRREVSLWVVQKRNGSWRVDAVRTLTILREALGF